MNGSNMDGTDASKKPDFDRKPTSRRPTRRCIFIIAALIILCIVICIVLAVTLRPKSKDDCPKGIHCDWRAMPHSEFLTDKRCDSLCTTQPCIKSAQYVLNRIDSAIDPCEDFYGFACGTFEEKALTFSEQDEGVYSLEGRESEVFLNLKEIIDAIDENPGKSSFALRMTKGLYDNCMETDHHPEIMNKEFWKQLFAENGRLPWPLLSENTRNDQKHFVRMMATTLLYGVNPFFELKDIQMQTINRKGFLVFRFTESEDIAHLEFLHKDWNPKDDYSIAGRYIFALRRILTELGLDVDDLSSIITNVIEVEKHFLDLTTKAIESSEKVYENNRHLSYEYHNHSCQDLDHTMGNIKWCELVKLLRKEYGFPTDTPIRVELPTLGDYFAAVNTVLGHYLERDTINYIGVKFMLGFMKYMPSPLREIFYREKDLFPDGSMYLPMTARWQQCVEVVNEFMVLPLEREYLKTKLDGKARNQVQDMVKKIKKTYLSLLDKMSLLKTVAKGTDHKKLIRDMKFLIGRADEVLNLKEENLDKFYSMGFQDSGVKGERRPLLESVLQMKEFYIKIPMRAEVDDYASTSFNSQFFRVFYHSSTTGEIGLSYGGLVFPMYLLGRPMYLEYANCGTVISTYIIHALYMEIPPRNDTVQQIFDAANCLQEQSHLYKTGNAKLKGDDGNDILRQIFMMMHTSGIHAGYQAYMDYLKQNDDDKGLPGLPFTNEQLFFISAAQANCETITEKGYADFPSSLVSPARFRVNVAFANLKEFSEAFRCPADSSMNLKRRCCVLGDGKLSSDCK